MERLHGERMTVDEILEGLSEIIRECTDRDGEIREETDLFVDLGLDSVEVFQVIVRTEEDFGIEFDDVDLLSENFSQIGSFCRLIQRELEKGGRDVRKED